MRLATAMVEEPFSSFCHEVLSLDHAVRGVCITNEIGRALALAYRLGLLPVLTTSELEKYVVASIIGTYSRQMFEAKTGKLHYTFAIYDKLVSITIPIAFTERKQYFLLASFDVGADYKTIVEDSIMPLIMKNKNYFE